MYDRHIAPLLLEALADTPVVLLNGARQSGKSTLAQSLREATPRRYLTLDDHTTLAAARSDPAGFIAALAGPVVIIRRRNADMVSCCSAKTRRPILCADCFSS